VFDFKQPSKTSHALMLRAIEVFGRMHNAYAVPGNHDLSADRIESLFAKQPLGVLIRSGAIKILDGWMHDDFSEAPNLPVYGVPWQQDWDATIKNPEAWRAWASGTAKHSLLVTHAPLFPDGTEPPYEFIDLDDLSDALGAGSVFYGHIHDDHGIHDHEALTLANHGSLNRARLTESDIKRTVQVTVWDSTTGAFDAVPIPKQLPANMIFKMEAATTARNEQRSLDEFLSAVGHSTLDISSTHSITEHIRTLDAPEPVKQRSIEMIEEQDS
jgi:DNA repair exonuclease SbcCD nuclease subunit